MEELIESLSKYGTVQTCKESVVFILFMTAGDDEDLSSWITVTEIQRLVLNQVGKKYPNLEVMNNAKSHLLLVLGN